MKLEVVNGSYAYPSGRCLFEDLNYRLEDQSILTVLGRNGVGKTTLLKCIMGILKWRNGTLRLNGEDVGSALKARGVAYVPQAYSFSFSYTVRDIVTMGRARYMGSLSIPSKHDYACADAALEQVGIADLRNRGCGQLSGGQLQLVFIARALAAEPEIMILDEPEHHLDFNNQFLVLELIERLVHENHMSAIINTHYPDHALQLADKSLMLRRGAYLFGDTKELLTVENVRAYFGVESVIEVMERNHVPVPVFAVTGRMKQQEVIK